ncbi:hypothetical protein Verru16b_01572 [Lacunisphaera limnophila]|uniref:GYF domain-containing protein n=1 Tax=Lacunisphaera limnophila TaxID=1838286 RepID=A0A1D8AUG1_9BACT|nr:hypothetical protein [Lacunisphaera limnophila]AOS44510.1 hypothetical protein Verru16b_01572 [Lacunisphaera limnophila]
MFTILGADGKEYGPVAEAKVKEWILGGRANLATKARRADGTVWQTLGDFPEFGGAPTPTPAGPGEPPVTAPAFAPAAGPAPLAGTPAEISARLAGQAAAFDLFSCLSRSFELWKSNFLPLVGITLLALIVQFVANMIPLVGFICSLLLTGVFTGGIYYFYIGKIRGEPRDVGDVFAGFSKAFVPLMLTGLILNVVSFVVMAVFFGPLFIALFQAGLSATPENFEMPVMSGLALGWMAVGVIPMVYLSVSWILAYALVIDQGLSPWTALEVSRRVITRRWFSMFFLLICAGILGMLGLIGLGIGVVFTIPLFFGALLYAYEDLFRPQA